MTKTLALLFALCAGCAAPVGVSGISVPRDAAATCRSHCESIGLTLEAVVIMANHAGCVCAAAPAGDASATAGGMAAILMQQRSAQYSRSTPR